MRLIDHLILLGYLVLLAVVMQFCRKTTDRHSDFFLAGRSVGALPMGLSVMVTTFSAVNYLALPGEVYGYGLYVTASFPVFFLAAWPVVAYWIPFFRERRLISIYAFLEERFDLRVRTLCSGLFLLWRVFWMAVALYASCRIMSLLTELDFLLLVLLTGLAAAIYSAFGGMKAVIWTDVMQFCVLFGSILLAVFLVCRGDDFLTVLNHAEKLRPFYPADMKFYSPDPGERITLWSALLGTFVMFLTRFGADQMVMQRYLSASSVRAAQRGLWINGIASVLSLSLLAVFGLALSVYAVRSGIPSRLPPVKVIAGLLKTFPPGAPGLVAAGLLAASMSSIDSGLNSCTAALSVDFLDRFRLRRISPGTLTFLLALPIMAVSAFLLPVLNRQQTLFVILNKTVNTIGTPLLAVMLYALFRKKISASSVFYGTLSGILLTLLISVTDLSVSLHYYALLSLISTLLCIESADLLRKFSRLFS